MLKILIRIQVVWLVVISFCTTSNAQSLEWVKYKSTLDLNDFTTLSSKIEEFIQTPGVTDLDKAHSLNFLSRKNSKLGKLKEADELISRAKEFIGTENTAILRSLLQIESVVASKKHEYQRSIRLSTQCIELSEQIPTGETFIAMVLNGRGIAYQQAGKFKEAIDDYERALSLAEKNDLKFLTVNMLINLGTAYNELKAFGKSEATYLKALDRIELKTEVDAKVRLFVNLGNNALDAGRYSKGHEYYLEAEKSHLTECKDIPNGSIYVGLGDVAMRRSNYSEAKRHYETASVHYDRAQDTAGQSRAISRLAKINKLLSDHSNDADEEQLESIVSAEIAKLEKQLTKARQSEDRSGLASLYSQLNNLYQDQGEFRKSAELLEEQLAREKESWMEIGRFSVAAMNQKDEAINKLNDSNRLLSLGLLALIFSGLVLLVLWQRKLVVNSRLKLATASANQEQQKNSILLEQLSERQKEAGLATMSAGVLHDFNNYLTAIIASAEMGLSADSDNKDVFLSSVVRCGMSAADLTESINEFVGNGRPYRLGSCDLFELVNENQVSWSNLTKQEVDLRFQFPTDARLFVPIKSTEFERVIINLIKNSNEAIEDSGEISVVFAKFGEQCRITVTDTGTGMDESVKSRVLDPYFSTKGIGRGWGLTSAKGIVERCGGSMQIQSGIEKGTSVVLFVPLISKAEHKAIQENLKEQLVQIHKPSNRLPDDTHIVIVEDDAIVLEGLKSYIESLNIRVTTFTNGSAATEYFRKTDDVIDGLVTDYSLNDQANGKELAFLAKAANPRCRVLLISGYAENEVFESSSFDGFLAKPFTQVQLVNLLHDLFDGQKRFQIGDVA